MAHFTHLDELEIDVSALDQMPESLAREHSALAISYINGTVHLVLPPDELNEKTLDKLSFLLARPIHADTADRELLKNAIDFYYPEKYAEIENCNYKFQFKCPKRWCQLNLTEDKNIRYCNECHQNVFLCRSIDELNAMVRKGNCVAISEENNTDYDIGLILFD